MGLFELIAAASGRTQDLKDAVARYKRLSPHRLQLNNKLVSRLSRSTLDRGAKELGILRGDSFVFDNEDQMSVLMDYCVYDVYREGRNAVDQYLCQSNDDLDSDEMVLLRAMQHATYALIAVRHVESGVGCNVRNLFTQESQLLIDIGLSKSAKPGLVIATRLFDFGDFVTTSGAALPIGVLDEDELEAWQREINRGQHDDSFDPAPLIRKCLEIGSSEQIAYIEATSVVDGDGGRRPPARRANSTDRQRALARRRDVSIAGKRRCSCGSGKMFKNCCASG